MARQQRLVGAGGLMLHVVIPEAALRLEIGGPALLSAQLERLLVAADTENITVQALPARAGAHPALASNFNVLHFANSKADPPLGYFDGPLGGYLISDAGEVADIANMFEDVRSIALDETRSVEMIVAVLKEMHEKGS
jgi:hypothetical protein